MIFNKFFAPKHQSRDPKVRLQAISSLSPDDPEQKARLHEMAFNDADTNVALAALTQLNSFALWAKMADIATDERIRKKAGQVVEASLTSDQGLALSDDEKQAYVRECKNSALLEKVLNEQVIKDSQLVAELLARIAKPHLYRQVFFATTDTALQRQLIDQFDDENTLQKVVKKVDNPAIKATAQERLAEIRAQKARPAELEKLASMVLSRLLALKECQDLPEFDAKREGLTQEFCQLSDEFAILNEQKSDLLRSKYSDIIRKLDNWRDTIAPAWQAQQAERELAETLETLLVTADGALQDINAELNGDVKLLTIGDVEGFEQRLAELREVIESHLRENAALTRQQRQALEQQGAHIDTCIATLRRLPEYQQALLQAENLLTAFENIAIPDTLDGYEQVQQILHTQQYNWRGLRTPFAANWPSSLDQRWEAVNGQWQGARTTLREQIRQQVARCRNKLKAIEGLISQGKYRAAIGLYSKVTDWFATLPANQQIHLQRQFAKATEAVENLKDWQDYIASPRRPELVSQAEQLAAQPLPVKQQVEAIKQLRQTWNSLGPVEDTQSKEMDTRFNQLLEQAFSPCRAHFAEQQAARDASLARREQLLTTLSEKLLQDPPLAELDRLVNDWQKQWREAGEVDHAHKTRLNQARDELLAQVQQRLTGFYADNATQKSKLVADAQGLAQGPIDKNTVEQAKALQQRWKTIGFAGKKDDQRLWREFRTCNDRIFERRAEQAQSERQQEQDALSTIERELTTLSAEAADACTLSTLDAVVDRLGALGSELCALSSHRRKQAEQHIRQCQNLCVERQKALRDRQREAEWSGLFETLHQWRSAELPEALDSLKASWRQWFVSPQPSSFDRKQLTIMMEILAQQPSPEEDNAARSELQLQMMADKLSGGESWSLQGLLPAWVGKGPISEQELSLLNRLQALPFA